MRHEMHLDGKWFLKVKKGEKCVEARLYDVKRKAIKVGDEIEFTSRDTNETLIVKVTKLVKFKTFNDFYNSYDKKDLGIIDEDYLSEINKFYTKEEIDKYEVLAIEFTK